MREGCGRFASLLLHKTGHQNFAKLKRNLGRGIVLASFMRDAILPWRIGDRQNAEC